jgi:hypothetical protein
MMSRESRRLSRQQTTPSQKRTAVLLQSSASSAAATDLADASAAAPVGGCTGGVRLGRNGKAEER